MLALAETEIWREHKQAFLVEHAHTKSNAAVGAQIVEWGRDGHVLGRETQWKVARRLYVWPVSSLVLTTWPKIDTAPPVDQI